MDFLVVQDFFMTPTAKEADFVLPASTWLEHDYIGEMWKRHGRVVARQKAVQVGEARSDYDILNLNVARKIEKMCQMHVYR